MVCCPDNTCFPRAASPSTRPDGSTLAVVLLLDFLMISKVVKLYRHVAVGQEVDRKEALSLYKYSMLYLALLFLSLVADRILTLTIPL